MLQIPEELIQKAFPKLMFGSLHPNEYIYGCGIDIYFGINHGPYIHLTGYELIFNPDYKFLEYAVGKELIQEFDNGWIPKYELVLLNLCSLNSSQEQTEYLKTLI